DKLQIQSDESIEWLTVVDMSGKEVSAFRPLEYGRTIEVDMNGIAEGTYLITLRSEKGTTASSLIMKK
ncbi:MAG: T9SS type A sorting domain-containing protein, partial [Bacteroidetes bacterium]|nr:T9SS type A sorting domain-containing protein [Bacteroidota bacterium]